MLREVSDFHKDQALRSVAESTDYAALTVYVPQTFNDASKSTADGGYKVAERPVLQEDFHIVDTQDGNGRKLVLKSGKVTVHYGHSENVKAFVLLDENRNSIVAMLGIEDVFGTVVSLDPSSTYFQQSVDVWKIMNNVSG